MSRSLQLILVEDDPNDGELIARHLQKAGLDCIIQRVQTGPGLITSLSSIKPDLIISDFSLPRFNGMEALKIANTHAPEVPFIFVSGTIGEETALEAMRNGATDYILKSNLARLSSAVERALKDCAIKSQQRQAEKLRRDQELRLQRLTRSYRMLSSTSSAILRIRSRSDLLDEICRIVVSQGGYERAVLSVVDGNARSIRPQACAGVDSKALRALDYSTLDSKSPGLNLAARAVLARSPVIVKDLTAESERSAHQHIWLQHGWPAIAALPLLVDGTAIGSLTLHSERKDAFDDDEVKALNELIANLCFGLQHLDSEEALHFLSYFDSLTGLAKRPLFSQRIGMRLKELLFESNALTLLLFDVQKLGAVNDSHGRHVGDRLIEEIAARIKQTYPNFDCAGYLGQGTFALALPTVASRDGKERGQLMQNAAAQLFATSFEIAGRDLRPSTRCGVAFYPQDGVSASELVQHAEAALQAAREDDEPCKVYGDVRERPASRTVSLETRLASALDRQEYLLNYQPKISIADNRLVGLEALLRWQDSELGRVPPSVFIPLLERSGDIVEVGKFVLEQAVLDILGWRGEGALPGRVAVNISSQQLKRREFVHTILSSIGPLSGHDVKLEIEVTESMLMRDTETSIRKLTDLKHAGVGVTIDDFGTGYSSFKLLSRLPIDSLKIDRSFIVGVADVPQSQTLVSTVISLARSFNLTSVAEGVETDQQLQVLRSLKCDQAQGFYLGPPVPSLEIANLIRRHGAAGSASDKVA
jgi:diguanylate cyclase (GGDEF)-like protein